MNSGSISVREIDGGTLIKVNGRANFECAVPLREVACGMDASGWVCFDMSDCDAIDSTFMGVMTMIGLKKVRGGGRKVGLAAASEKIQGLLRGLGVLKIFDTAMEVPESVADSDFAASGGDAATTARTVLEAHQTLVEADSSNEQQFRDVIAFAEADVRRLDKDS